MGSEAPVSIGDVVAGKYRVTRFLGAGGMGVVVEAEHLELGQPVALKFLHPNAFGAIAAPAASERFLREARAAVRIRSEHVARVLDVGRNEAGVPFMVMECLIGRDLGRVIQEDAPLEIVRAVGYMLQACEAIAVAHVIGIVHRDLKPSNIFVTTRPDGTPLVKVLDFGISKAVESEAPMSLTSTGEILGSPIYMSPEQLRNTRGVDRRTDIWSLGSVLYELLTRHHPFEAESMPTLCAMIAADPPRPLREVRPEIPADLDAAVLRCLEKQPANRFGSVADFASALLPFAGPDGLAAVGRIARIGAGNEVTAASAVATPKLAPPIPQGHEATAASAVALPGERMPSRRPVRRLVFVAAALLAVVAIAVVRLSQLSSPSASADLPRPPLASTEVTRQGSSTDPPPVDVPSGLVARSALTPTQARVEARPAGDLADGGPPIAVTQPPIESILQVPGKTKSRLNPSASAVPPRPPSSAPPPPASSPTPLPNEKPNLDPLIDQR